LSPLTRGGRLTWLRSREMQDDEVVQTLVVRDETPPMLDVRLCVVGIRFQAFVLRHEILVFAEQ